MMKIFLSSSVSTGIVESVESISSRSSKYFVNKYINYFGKLATKQFVLIAIGITMIIIIAILAILVIIIILKVVNWKKRRSHDNESEKKLIFNYLTSYIHVFYRL